jgi:multisubunit Na+/H+ antiporter MnhB subunit
VRAILRLIAVVLATVGAFIIALAFAMAAATDGGLLGAIVFATGFFFLAWRPGYGRSSRIKRPASKPQTWSRRASHARCITGLICLVGSSGPVLVFLWEFPAPSTRFTARKRKNQKKIHASSAQWR